MEKEADVVIIGGGIVGCASAYYLAKRGVKVVLVEKNEISSEGTGATFGIIRDIGRAPEEILLGINSLKIWEKLPAELEYDIGFVQRGGMFIAETEAELERLRAAAKIEQEYGVNSKIISAKEVKELFPIEGPVYGALYSEKAAQAEPGRVALGYANAAQKLGARIYTKTLCWDIGMMGGAVSSVVTTRGEIKTKIVVNAAGVHANRVTKMVGFHLPVKVVAIAIAETEPLPFRLRGWFRAPCSAVRSTIQGSLFFTPKGIDIPMDYYFGFDTFQDLRIWWPRFLAFRKILSMRFDASYIAREFKRVFSISLKTRRIAGFLDFEPKADLRQFESTLTDLYEFMPSIKEVRIARVWAGMIDISPDMLPVIGELDKPKGFVMGANLCGHGFTLGPAVGHIISELILNGKASLPIEAFRPARFREGKFAMPPKGV